MQQMIRGCCSAARRSMPYHSIIIFLKIGHLITMQALRGHNSSLLFPAVFLRAFAHCHAATTRLLLAVMDEGPSIIYIMAGRI